MNPDVVTETDSAEMGNVNNREDKGVDWCEGTKRHGNEKTAVKEECDGKFNGLSGLARRYYL